MLLLLLGSAAGILQVQGSPVLQTASNIILLEVLLNGK